MTDRNIDKHKRQFLLGSGGLTALSMSGLISAKSPVSTPAPVLRNEISRRLRHVQLGWPFAGQWKALADSLQGKLFEVRDPFAKCMEGPTACEQDLKNPENPFLLKTPWAVIHRK
jgi:hypothetical protein